MEQQQGTAYHMDLFGPTEEVRHGGPRNDGIGPEPHAEQQASAASEKREIGDGTSPEIAERPLAYALMERVCNPSYEPDPVRGVEIPKPGGGMRQLGIPTVRDRMVQQAVHQVLEPILDPTFSERSYGFRSGRRAEDALKQAQADISEGYYVAVDIDVSKFFDRVNHDRLMARLARYVGDKHLLRIVRRFLEGLRRSDVPALFSTEAIGWDGPSTCHREEAFRIATEAFGRGRLRPSTTPVFRPLRDPCVRSSFCVGVNVISLSVNLSHEGCSGSPVAGTDGELCRPAFPRSQQRWPGGRQSHDSSE